MNKTSGTPRANDRSVGELTPREKAKWNARLAAGPFGRWARNINDQIAEARAFLDATRALSHSKAIEYVQKNPPSAACILFLAEVGHEVMLAEQTRAGADAANAPKAKAREWVQAEWKAHANAYDNKKAPFARDYMLRMKRELGVDVSHKTITDKWLKTL